MPMPCSNFNVLLLAEFCVELAMILLIIKCKVPLNLKPRNYFHAAGRYFTTTVLSSVVNIINVRISKAEESVQRSYYINDGVYGSLASARYDPFLKLVPLLVQV